MSPQSGKEAKGAHSPAPWKTRELTGDDHRGMGWLEDANGRDISAYGDMALSIEENRANAALFAAVPDLLALAKQYASECADCDGTGVIPASGVEGSADADCVACAHIRAAIAKAVRS